MPIKDRDLKPGTVLVASYKKREHRAEVVKTKDGLRYKTEDGEEFKSPSSAGAHVKGGGKTCDGWEFWSVEGAPPVLRRPQRQAGGEAKAPRQAKAETPTEPEARKPKAVRAPKAKSARKPKPKAKKGGRRKK
jgi:hypothetical protein